MSRSTLTPATAELITPKSPGELSDAVREANDRNQALLIQGGNTLHGMGRPAERCDRTVRMNGLRAVKAYAFADLTVSVEAGMTVRALRALLAERGQFVPIDVPRAHEATIGGALASGWLGPRRHMFGRPRDYVIGSHVVLADGTAVAAGGMVVKNVTGYDMSKLYVGSFGTLGVIASANFKTLPLPQQARAFLARLPENSRVRAMLAMQELAVPPSAALWAHGFRKTIEGDDGDDGRMLILLEGSAALLERATRDLRSALGRAGVPETTIVEGREPFDRALDGLVTNVSDRSITYRILGLAEEIDPTLRGAYRAARKHDLKTESVVDVINGDVFARVSAKDATRFGEHIEAFDEDLHVLFPKAIVVSGESPLRSALNVWGAPPPAIERMRALKARFDPKRTLNPGRFVGGI
ncbi:MAG: FAD-binding oxidoreductase [Vulcanimicrobiaceae bacterium]